MSSLYLHIPFCSSKCPYCDFFSQVGTQQQLEDYVKLLILNAGIAARDMQTEVPLATIFFGGGTPSLLTVKQLEKILNCIDHHFGIKAAAEITLEANPGTLSLEQLKGYRRAGINRLSLGVQSLKDENLQVLGRIHTVKKARESIRNARSAGFDNLSLDLMFALPNQNLTSLELEISRLISFEPEHISVYGLSFEEGTEFARRQQSGEIESCDEGLYADQYQLLQHQLTAAGYGHYEISNFARSNRACEHNQAYWRRKNCLGLGIGAHGFVNQKWGERWHIPVNFERYKKRLLQGVNPSELLETYEQTGAMKEYVYLALRTNTGIDLEEFQQKFGCRVEQVFSDAINKVKKYLRFNNGHCYFAAEGWIIYDHLISNFL